MNGGHDPRFVLARRALLDALEALSPHHDSLTLVGAQAVYFHVGDADLAVAPYTTDADIGIDPRILGSTPPAIAETLLRAGFRKGKHPGIYLGSDGAQIDLLVPKALAGAGRRGARLGRVHGNDAAMHSRGIEGALVDFSVRSIPSLEPERDARSIRLKVAGPGALIVAKLTKVGERVRELRRARESSPAPALRRAMARYSEATKDCLDIFRLLRLPTEVLARAVRIVQAFPLSNVLCEDSLRELRALFESPESEGCSMLQRSVEIPTAPAGTRFTFAREVYQCVALAGELLRDLGR